MLGATSLGRSLCRYSARYSAYAATTTTTGAATTPRKTLALLGRQHAQQTPIVALTAHDCPSGRLADRAGVDIVLVGDSLAMVALGYADTREITLQEMIHHARAVRRGVRTAVLVVDLPFGSYESSAEHACRSAVRVIKESQADAVKLEGGRDIAPTVRRLVAAGIPVLGHVGLLPQRHAAAAGYAVQGKTAAQAMAILHDAVALQDAGCFGVVVEAIPAVFAQHITAQLRIPTIGIGAGVGCSGQVLVQSDLLGLSDGFKPRFVRQYGEIGSASLDAIQSYVSDVRSRHYPAEQHTYPAKDEAEIERFRAALASSSVQ